jgi:hypothetical protein
MGSAFATAGVGALSARATVAGSPVTGTDIATLTANTDNVRQPLAPSNLI